MLDFLEQIFFFKGSMVINDLELTKSPNQTSGV